MSHGEHRRSVHTHLYVTQPFPPGGIIGAPGSLAWGDAFYAAAEPLPGLERRHDAPFSCLVEFHSPVSPDRRHCAARLERFACRRRFWTWSDHLFSTGSPGGFLAARSPRTTSHGKRSEHIVSVIVIIVLVIILFLCDHNHAREYDRDTASGMQQQRDGHDGGQRSAQDGSQ